MESRTAPLYRLFFAIKPPAMITLQIDHFARTLMPDAQHVAAAHQHVTIGITTDAVDYPYEVIKALRRAAGGVQAEPFDLRLDRLSVGGRSAALCPSRRNEGLALLQAEVARAMARAGATARPGWRFDPHQTLFYRETRPTQRRIAGFGWRVEELVLVCSHVGHTRHEPLGAWPLVGGAQLRLL